MNGNLPPPNRALGWYRFMLWMMPAFVVVVTAWGMEWLSSEMDWEGYLPGLFCVVVNIATTLGIGFFESQFHRPPSSRPADAAAIFTALQILVIPAVLFVLGFVLALVISY